MIIEDGIGLQYRLGFDEGERAAFTHRQRGMPPLIRPNEIKGQRAQGFWDGYTPRSLTWALRQPKTGRQWWCEEDE